MGNKYSDWAYRRLANIERAKQELMDRHNADPDSVTQFNLRDARLAAARKRERQRLEHLVFGARRPTEKVKVGKRGGRGRPKTVIAPVQLEPGVEEAVAKRERWSHRQGTPETEDHAARTHQGALAQLQLNGTITKDQLEWAAEIANVHRAIESDVSIAIASLEARVDQSRRGGEVVEAIRRVRLHLAYSIWRAELPQPTRLVLDMIVGEPIGYTVAAKRHRVHNRKALRYLLAALDRWPACVNQVYRTVRDQDIEEAQSRAAA